MKVNHLAFVAVIRRRRMMMSNDEKPNANPRTATDHRMKPMSELTIERVRVV